jgi:hypothetical protein
MFKRVWSELIGRVDGPFAFRIILQPIVAAILAVRAGLRDAREGRPPHFLAILTDRTHRSGLLRDTWKEVRKVFIAAVIIDVIYELVVFRWIYPVQPFIVAIVLAVIPYLAIRGLVNRLARRHQPRVEKHKRDAA